ncbi:RICIN domain-containing protein [Actinophytocola xanthii]|uniref:Beta-xylosidase n=1 Tax=Actinophytocola xanthii TaxID=1912961 RepID=A0A1Q8C001_9PSEU|nr:RICIN domain-containing protein [Actinophytocola xanthii]OLF07680.1 beta-xylosidase [Actinophytocola xanthii]
MPQRCGLAVVLAVLSALVLPGSAVAAPVTITNGTQFTDTNGNVVHAHGGGVLKVGSYYYWFGENRNPDNTFRAVSAYRSTDLRNWEFRNNVLTQSSHSELQVANIERPKVIFNASTGQYVMWMHKENGRDYGEARAAVATASTVDGNYTWRGSFRPLDYMSRDITLFKDDDGTTYMISAANENADLHVYRLTSDYLQVSARVQRLWPGSWREAPAMFKRNGVYFLLTSGATGWNPNQQKYATASSVTGSWSALSDVGNATAFDSQTAFVLPVQGSQTTSYLYLGDRWAGATGGAVNESRYVWLPLSFPSNTTMTMSYSSQVTIDTATGAITATGAQRYSFTARHSGKCADIPSSSQDNGTQLKQYPCNGGNNQGFEAQPAGDEYYRLVAAHSGKCLDVSDASTADSATVIQYTCGSGTHQQWRFEDAGSGYYRIVARHSGKCLDVTSGSTADGALVKQYTCGSDANQQWRR